MKWPIFSIIRKKGKNAESLGNPMDGLKFQNANGRSHFPKLVRILYARHDEYSNSDFVAYLVFEILSDNTRYTDTDVHIDRKDSFSGYYKEYIFNEIENRDTIIIIVMSYDSLNKGHLDFYEELSLCVELINYKRKERKMFIPLIVYKGSPKQGSDKIKRALCSYLDSYQNERNLSTNDINNLFLLNRLNICCPTCDQIIDIKHRELYKENLRIHLEQFIK